MNFRDELCPTDVDDVRELVTATGFFRADEIAIAAELVEETLDRGSASGYRFLLAGHSGTSGLAGYACFGPIPATLSGFDLYWIAVRPDCQGQGLGQRLLAVTELRCRAAGGGRLYADTSGRDDYAPTRAFYRRCGFGVAARFPDFYADGDDKVVFSKALRL